MHLPILVSRIPVTHFHFNLAETKQSRHYTNMLLQVLIEFSANILSDSKSIIEKLYLFHNGFEKKIAPTS